MARRAEVDYPTDDKGQGQLFIDVGGELLPAPVLRATMDPQEMRRIERYAMKHQRTLAVKIDNVVVEVAPLRLSQAVGGDREGKYILETFQLRGPKKWPAAVPRTKHMSSTDCFPLQDKITENYQGWRNLTEERFQAMELLDRRFEVPQGFNYESRRYGRVEAMVSKPKR